MIDSLPLPAGTWIGGHYVIGTLINKGGFGAVYRGLDTSEGNRPCAIKETYDVTPSARRQALTEAAVLFTIKSKHLPGVYDAFEDSGRFYLVMQLIEGQNLLQLLQLRGAPCNEQEALNWLLPIMQVLQELHSRNPAVIHRDIKPGNIILTPDQTAVLVDFGLTKLYDPSSDTQTMVRAVSEGFSPIEQYIGKTSPQSDIYSMAATMYFLLTQRIPPAAINRGYRDDLVPPRALNPLISQQVERALLKALAVNADERYASMREFAEALQQPAFAAYADPTVANSRVQAASAGTEVVGPPMPPQPPLTQRASGVRPAVPARQAPPPAYPVLPPAPSPAPAPSTPLAPSYRPLPSPYSQGCLWGLLQGVLAALIILSLKKEVYFYVAIVEGFLFYILAGFMTTRKGGSSFRGAWTGIWAGITSTIVFWIALLIGLMVLVAERLQIDTTAARMQHRILNIQYELGHALQVVAPTFPNQPANQPGGVSLAIFLAGGLLCAMALGWLGGVLGTSRFRAKMQRTRRRF